MRRAAVGMPHHDDVRADALDGPAGIDQRLALLDAGGGCGYQGGHRAQCLGGELEGGAGAGGGFVEQQHHAFSAQQLRRAVRVHAPRQRQDRFDLRGRKLVDAQQRTEWLHCASGVRSSNTTLSAPSLSCSLTSMISSDVVWMVRPTKLASMGSSRWPRSMSTQS